VPIARVTRSNRRDLDAFLEFTDPEVKFTTRFVELEGRPEYRAHDDVREWWQDLLGIFPDLSFDVLEVRAVGAFTIAAFRLRGHGVDSDAPFEENVWAAGEWRDGRIVWWQTVGSEAAALEAAGLSE
jgi:ketosteroid isomerase-like protein